MTERRSFVDDTFSATATKGLALACLVLSQILLARGLGADGRGVLAAILVYPMLLATLFEGGVRQAAAHMIGSRQMEDGEVIGAALICHLILSILGVMVCLALLTLGGRTSSDWVLAGLAVAVIPLNLAITYAGGILLGKGTVTLFNRVTLHYHLAYVSAVVLLFVTDRLTIRLAFVALILGLTVGALQGVRLVIGQMDSALRMRWTVVVAVVRKGAMYALALFLITFNYRVGIVMLDFLSSEVELGRYVVASQLTELLWQMPAAIALVVLARSSAADHRPFSAAHVARVVRVTVAMTLLGAICLGIGSFFLMGPVFGADFTEARHMVTVLLPGAVVVTMFKIVNVYLAGRGRPTVSLVAIIPAIVVNCCLCLVLIPAYGAVGASAAASISYMGAAVLIGRIFIAESGVSWQEFLILTDSDWAHIGGSLRRAVANGRARIT